jgi:hypothetical protein
MNWQDKIYESLKRRAEIEKVILRHSRGGTRRSRSETSGPRYSTDLAPGEIPMDSEEMAGRKDRFGGYTTKRPKKGKN